MDKKSKTNQEIEDNSKIKQKSKSTSNKKLNKKAISYIMLASLWAGSGFGWFLYYYNHQKSVPVLRKGYEEQYYKELEKWLTPQQRKQREEFLKQAKEYEKQLKLEKEKRLEYASRHLVKFINDFDLGAINDNQDKTIISILENKFEQVKGQIRVDETFKTKEYARIIPIKNSKYNGEVTVNFTIKTKLNTVITKLYLDKFDNPTQEQIIAKVNELNPDLNLTKDDITVEIKTNENKAVIKAKPDSSKYQGQVEVTYNIRPKIADKISTTSLGALLDKDKNSILNAINKANENLNLTLDQVDIDPINDTSAIVKAKENNNYQGQVTVNFTVKKQLEQEAKQLNLGALLDNKEQSIFEAFKNSNKNVNLNLSDVTIGERRNGSATITVKPTNNDYQGKVTVTFTIKTKLQDIITKLHLDKFDNPTQEQIITKVNELNPDLNLTKDDITVEIKTNENKAVIKAKPDSSKYQGQVEVTYNIRPKIADKISTTSLGALLDKDKNSILNAINKANENLNLTLDQVDIDPINDTSAIVKAKENNNYQGQVTVNFTVKKQLEQEAKQLNLGALLDNKEQSIFEAFKNSNKNVNLNLSDVTIGERRNGSATITVKPTNNDYQGKVTVTFTIKTKLQDIITKLYLDKFDNPTQEQIITKVNELNPDLNLTKDDITVEIKTNENKAVIKAKPDSSKYQGQVEVTYNIRPKIADKISTTSLGTLLDKDKNSILNAINKANENLNLTLDQVDIDPINDTSAIVKAKENNNYQGQVTVNFTVKKQLEQEAKQLNLGALLDNKEQSIFEAFKNSNKNVNLNLSDVTIGERRNGSATITVKPTNNDYQGKVTVTFTIKTKLQDIITKLHLDKFDNPTQEQIITKVNELNPDLNLTKDDITVEIKTNENKAVIKAKPDSSKYQGQVEVTYNIRPKIADKISTTSLGTLLDKDKNSILNAINKANENLNLTLDQVDIDPINDTSAIVKAKENNNYQGQVTVNFTIKTKLQDIIRNTNLGYIKDNTSRTLLDLINSKNDWSMNENHIKLNNITNTSATITPKSNGSENKYQGQVIVNFKIKTKLQDIIRNTDLGYIKEKNFNSILKAINEKNPGINLTSSDIAWRSLQRGQQVEIYPETNSQYNPSNKYQGQVTVNFKIKTKLQDIIRNTDLGYIKEKNFNSILKAINEKNPGINLTSSDIAWRSLQRGQQVEIYPETNSQYNPSNKYQGQVIVNFKIKTKLQDIIRNTDLGYIKEKNFNSILKAINEKNPGINLTSSDIAWRSLQRGQQVEIYPETNSQYNPSNKYQGQVRLTFITKPPMPEKQHVYDGTKVVQIGWKTLENGTVQIKQFRPATTEVPVELPPWITSLYGAFVGLESSSVKNLDKWNTSNVTDMGEMFYGAEKFNQPLNNWKTENVVDMNHMFFWASSFNQDISMWNTSNVTNMAGMFFGAYNFNQNISIWDVSNVTDMSYMFKGAQNFNQDISMWDVGKVTKWDNFGWGIFSSKLWQIPEKFR
ncbi:BspA family leucine-rich repeat surface protein [Mycoplasma sp. 06067-C1-B144P-99-0482-3]|uniref:BspA family leucine-rich repeat surface protein n=1 Tax=Mycoplasma sp. 06067-C1-B144P-99-0482-3 TaxID=3117438 RepID=UPI003DA3C4A8